MTGFPLINPYLCFVETKNLKRRNNTRQVIRFILVGTLNALITALVVWLLMDEMGCNYLWSNSCGYIAALINNFFWSKYWVFAGGRGAFLRQVVWFLLAFIFAYGAQFLALLAMVEGAGWNEYVSQFLGLFIYGAVNFVMNKKVTFVSSQIQ